MTFTTLSMSCFVIPKLTAGVKPRKMLTSAIAVVNRASVDQTRRITRGKPAIASKSRVILKLSSCFKNGETFFTNDKCPSTYR